MALSSKTLVLLLLSSRGIFGLDDKNDVTTNETENVFESFEIFSGFQLKLHDEELRIKLDLRKMFPVTDMQSRTHNDNDKHGSSGMEKFGSMLAMIPLIMQMLSLPGAIASIKMSLLKTIAVGKLALLVMLFNMLRNQQRTEVVMVHQAPPQHHDHFYPHMKEEYDDDDKGWFG